MALVGPEISNSDVGAEDFRTLLQKELLRRCRLNASYSARSFAKFLGIESSWLSKILRGKRPTSSDLILKLGARLGLSPAQLEVYLAKERRNKVLQSNAKTAAAGEESARQFLRIAQDTFEVISDWYHVAILELSKVAGFRPESRWISRRLGISQVEVDLAVERLERVGMIRIDRETGEWHDLTKGYTSHNVGPMTTSVAHREFQKQLLNISLEAVAAVPIERRDHSSMVMAIDPEDLDKAKEIVDRFRHEMSQFLENSSRKSEVYALQVGLFPLSDVTVSTGHSPRARSEKSNEIGLEKSETKQRKSERKL